MKIFSEPLLRLSQFDLHKCKHISPLARGICFPISALPTAFASGSLLLTSTCRPDNMRALGRVVYPQGATFARERGIGTREMQAEVRGARCGYVRTTRESSFGVLGFSRTPVSLRFSRKPLQESYEL